MDVKFGNTSIIYTEYPWSNVVTPIKYFGHITVCLNMIIFTLLYEHNVLQTKYCRLWTQHLETINYTFLFTLEEIIMSLSS